MGQLVEALGGPDDGKVREIPEHWAAVVFALSPELCLDGEAVGSPEEIKTVTLPVIVEKTRKIVLNPPSW